MKNLLKRILNIVFVRHCVVCGKTVSVNCRLNLCKCCETKTNTFGYTVDTYGKISVSVLPYENHIRKYIKKFKFSGRKYLGETFAEVLNDRLRTFPWYSMIDCVTCVPMKGRNRPYNQSSIIGEHIAKRMGVPFKEDALRKLKNNPPFYKLTIKERLKALKGAYDVGDDKSFSGETVLLIDDIYTTGLTLEACRQVLLKNGAKTVYSATVCYGVNTNK